MPSISDAPRRRPLAPFLALLLALLAGSAAAQVPGELVRGPYLQMGGPDRITIRWRTASPQDSVVNLGPSASSLPIVVSDPAMTTEHSVTVLGLSPETAYHYAIGSTGFGTLAGGDDAHRFVTAPPPGAERPLRIWAIGDSGTGNQYARLVRDAYYTYTGRTHTDLWLMLGDNAYSSGTDAQYQTAVFQNMYEEMLTRSVLWPTLGNHDGISADSATETGPYYDIFELPRMGEVGGVASGTEAYYSFDWGNVHFVCLDSHETDRSPTGPMATWLAADLAANASTWTIAYFHHGPYTKGSHDSDAEIRHIEIRENIAPILEAGGVDLVLSGHSHGYERSMYLHGHYDYSPTFDPMTMGIDTGDGRLDGGGPYRDAAFATPGTVYIVAGSSGTIGGGTFDHPVMIEGAPRLGSLVIDVHGEQMDVRFIREHGVVADRFTMMKGRTQAQPTSFEPIAADAVWRFHDLGVDLGTSWRDPAYDDSGWAQGAGPLGFGETGIVTTTSDGAPGPVPTTTYFRRDFTFDGDPTELLGLQLGIAYDDGFVAFVNGVEVARTSNLPAGATYSDLASPPHEATDYEFVDLSDKLWTLVPGNNVLAIEVHQTSTTSSDLVLHALLFAQRFRSPVGPCGDGFLLGPNGLPEEVLSVNGSTGSLARSVELGLGEPITTAVEAPATPGPHPFLIAAWSGPLSPDAAFPLSTTVGCLVVPISLLYPNDPGAFLLANSFGPPAGFVPATPAPWSATYGPGIPFPAEITMQGVLQTQPGIVRTTNAVRVVIR